MLLPEAKYKETASDIACLTFLSPPFLPVCSIVPTFPLVRFLLIIYWSLFRQVPGLKMSPPSAIEPHQNGDASKPSNIAPLEPGLNEVDAKIKMPHFPGPPTFDDPYKERAYLKGRLAGEQYIELASFVHTAYTRKRHSGFSENMVSTRVLLDILPCEILWTRRHSGSILLECPSA